MDMDFIPSNEFFDLSPMDSGSPPNMNSPQKVCRICEDKSDGAHFGVESCRACAAFFRRSVVMRKNYICRQGQENCNINKTVRCMCRCCRFKKCVLMGMMKEAVQSPRDQIGKRGENTDAMTVKLEHADSTSVLEPFVYDQGIETLADVFATEQRLIPIIKRLKDGYAELRAQRSSYNINVEGTSSDYTYFPRKVCHRHGYSTIIKDHENVVNFVRKSFPGIDELEPEQKKVLYRNFFASFVLFDSGYNTYLQGGDQADKWFLADGNFIDMSDFQFFYSSFEGGINPDEAIRLFRPSFHLFVRNLLVPMRCLGLTEVEFLCLMALTFFSHGVDGATYATDKHGLAVRESILRELTTYYTRIAFINDYTIRLGHVSMILPSLQRITNRFREDIAINKLFNAADNLDPTVYNLINGNGLPA